VLLAASDLGQHRVAAPVGQGAGRGWVVYTRLFSAAGLDKRALGLQGTTDPPCASLQRDLESWWLGYPLQSKRVGGASALVAKVTCPSAPNLLEPRLRADASAKLQAGGVSQAAGQIPTGPGAVAACSGAKRWLGLRGCLMWTSILVPFRFAGSQRDGFLATLKTTPARYPSGAIGCSDGRALLQQCSSCNRSATSSL